MAGMKMGTLCGFRSPGAAALKVFPGITAAAELRDGSCHKAAVIRK